MAKKIRYIYDEETCSYRELRVSPASYIKTMLSYLSISGLIACVMVAIFLFSYGDPKYALLESQNEKLSNKVKEYEDGFTILESRIDSLQTRDSELYRSILNADPISQGVWEGGTGGAAIDQSSDPQILKEAERRLDKLKNKIRLQATSYSELINRVFNMKDELNHIPAIKPVPGKLISGFGHRMHPIHKVRRMHAGIDLQAKTGTPVYATGDGVVKWSGIKANGYGIHVDIDHGYGYETKYAHLDKLAVKKGQKVKRGDIIGYSGNTGLSKGPHLHYEIIKDGVKINPIDYFMADLNPEEYTQMKKEALVENESMD